MTTRCKECHQALPQYGGIVADDERGEICFEEKFIILPSHEFALFQYLLERRGRVSTKESLVEFIYQLSPDKEPELKIIDVFVCKMRKRLEPMGLHIDTHWGRGYSLREPKRQAVAA